MKEIITVKDCGLFSIENGLTSKVCRKIHSQTIHITIMIPSRTIQTMPSEGTTQNNPPVGVVVSVFQGDPSDQCRENKDNLYSSAFCKPGLPGCGLAVLLAEPGWNMSQELHLSTSCLWGTCQS